MRNFDLWCETLVDDKPFFGRWSFFKLHTTDKVSITDESGTPLSNPILSDTYGRTSSQVFLPDEDVTVVMEKYIGSGDMSEAPDTIEYWSEVRTFDSLKNTVTINLNGEGVVAGYAATMDELRQLDTTLVNYAMLCGYNTLGDMPPVFYKLEINSISPDDGGGIIMPTDTTKRWRLITPQILDVRVFGVFPSDSYVDVAPMNSQLQAAFNYANSHGIALYIPAVYSSGYYAFEGGAHNLNNTLYIDSGAHLVAKAGTTSTVYVDKIEGAAPGFLSYDGVYNTGKVTLTVKDIRTSWMNDWNQSDYVLVPTNSMIVDSPVVINAARTFSNLARVSIETPNWDPGATIGFDSCQEFVSPGNLSLYGHFQFYNMTGITDRWWNLSASSYRVDPSLVSLNNCQYTLHDFSYVVNFIQLKYTDGERNFNLEGREYNAGSADVYNNTTWSNGEIANLNLTGTVALRNIKGSVYSNSAGWTDVSIEDCYITGSLPYNISGNFYAKSSSFTSTYAMGSYLPAFHGSSCTIRDCIFNGYRLQVPYNAVITGCTFDTNGLGAYSNVEAYTQNETGYISITFSDNVLNGAKLVLTPSSALYLITVVNSVFVGNAITNSRDGTNFIQWNSAYMAPSGHSYSYKNNDGPNVLQQESYTTILKNVPNWYNDGGTPPNAPYMEYTDPVEVFSMDGITIITGYTSQTLPGGGVITIPTYGKSESTTTYARQSRIVGLTIEDFNIFCFSVNDFNSKYVSLSAVVSKREGQENNKTLATNLNVNSVGIPSNLSLPNYTTGNPSAQSSSAVPVPDAYQDLVLQISLTDVRTLT